MNIDDYDDDDGGVGEWKGWRERKWRNEEGAKT